jgi:hypothetical protein
MALHPLRQRGAPPKNLQYNYNHFRNQSPITNRFFLKKVYQLVAAGRKP